MTFIDIYPMIRSKELIWYYPLSKQIFGLYIHGPCQNLENNVAPSTDFLDTQPQSQNFITASAKILEKSGFREWNWYLQLFSEQIWSLKVSPNVRCTFAPLMYAQRILISFTGTKSQKFFQSKLSFLVLRIGGWCQIRIASYLWYLSIKP